MAAELAIVSILIPAVGGQGGGVLSEWIVDAALDHGLPRPRHLDPGRGPAHRLDDLLHRALRQRPSAEEPAFSLYPVPGALDVLRRAGIPRGRAHDRARLRRRRCARRSIASTHRLYSIHEKIATGRAIYPQADLQRAAEARRPAAAGVRRADAGARAWHRDQRDPARRAGGQRRAADSRGRVSSGRSSARASRWRPISPASGSVWRWAGTRTTAVRPVGWRRPRRRPRPTGREASPTLASVPAELRPLVEDAAARGARPRRARRDEADRLSGHGVRPAVSRAAAALRAGGPRQCHADGDRPGGGALPGPVDELRGRGAGGRSEDAGGAVRAHSRLRAGAATPRSS